MAGPLTGAYTPGDPVWPVMIAGDIPLYLKAASLASAFTPIFTPTHPNIIRLRQTSLDEHHPEIPVWQGILRHQPAPGHPFASLEQTIRLTGRPNLRFSAMRSLRGFLQEAALPADIRFHYLRYTAGTLALRQGVPLHTVSRMLGHSDPAMDELF